MKNLKWLWPLLPVILFALISFVYFYPDVSKGKVLFQHDTQQGLANGQEAQEYKKESGEVTRWTGSLFSGMPTFQTAPSYSSNTVLKKIENAYSLWMTSPVSLVFIMLLGFYILMLSLNVRWYLAAFGAIAYAFSSYFFIIIAAGHIWKFITLAYIPPTIAGLIWAYRGKYLRGAALVALFGALQIMSNHVQMSYYFFFVIVAMVIAFGVEHYRNHTMPVFFKATGVLVVAALLAVGVNASNLYHTYKYSKETMRGGHSELTTPVPDGAEAKEQPSKGGGLDKDYITAWSYGKAETLTLLIPNSKGGASDYLSHNKKAVEAASPEARPYLNQLPQYWGDQPFTSGPVYVGALIFFLFVLGCFIVKGPMKWALLGVTLFTIMLSWGHNMMWLTDLFIDYFPMYNKFRTVSSILVVAEFCMPLLAVLALKEIFTDPSILKREKRKFYWCGGVVAGIALLAALIPSLFGSFMSDWEMELLANNTELNPVFAGIVDARKAIFVADAWRTFFIVAIGFGTLWALCEKKINTTVAIIILSVTLIGDMYPVNKRYLNSKNFVRPERKTNPFPMTEADKEILKDTTLNYRVLDIPGFEQARSSYYHKTIGGYHAAKLRRYQDLIDRQINPDGKWNKANMSVINMLNARYIMESETKVEYNPYALGNAWFVSDIKWVDNADEEMAALNDFNPAKTAVIDRRFANQVGDPYLNPAPSDTIYETGYKPNELTYHYRSEKGGLAVFSEIYFPWGWEITVDGNPIEMARVNYVLRAVNLPAGEHEIVFRFDPKSVRTTETIAYISLVLILVLFLAWGGLFAWRKYQAKKQGVKPA